eukprot:scaffold31044_cov112-Isochrysis_galbana.AAC.6
MANGAWMSTDSGMPLPERRSSCILSDDGDKGVLDGPGHHRDIAQRLQVPLHQVRIAWLARPEVVQVVVLDVPRLGQHPVEPVHGAAADAAQRKAHRGEAARAVVLLVVAAVARVVRDHRPPE